jgi:tetratricopeptide (TPR) repeat protein
VARGGDLTRAIAITEEIDKISKSSAMGPMLRARILARQGKTREVAQAYGEALERNPRQPDVRVLLAQELVKLGRFDEALKQTKIVLDADKDRLDAALIGARALAELGSTDAEREVSRYSAAQQIESAIKTAPGFLDAYHELADIQLKRGRRPAAIEVLKRDLKSNPQDNNAVAKLIALLAGRGPGGEMPSARDVDEAKRVAAEIVSSDAKGSLILAAGAGFHKAGQLSLALPLSEKAVAMLDSTVAHMNLGDLLLSLAESQHDRGAARPLFERAVGEYDKVLKVQPRLVEAVNNKAWVLHSYLDRSNEALELARDLLKRADPATLPGEFYDTLGAIQEAVGRADDAEQSYLKGLGKSPEHPVLNYHFGKLIAADRSRGARAKVHLAKALAGRDQLSPEMARDAERLITELGRQFSAN